MARERGLGHEVHDRVRIARQQMAGDGETTGDVAEALPVLCVQEQRADAGRPNRRHGGTNNPIGTAASLKTAHSRGSGAALASRVPLGNVAVTSRVTSYRGILPLAPSHAPYSRWRRRRDALAPRLGAASPGFAGEQAQDPTSDTPARNPPASSAETPSSYPGCRASSRPPRR